MSTNPYDSELIRKYLNGQLDARAMHQLERQAQNDPFLMEALDGYGKSSSHQRQNLADLKARLHGRVTQRRKPVFTLWHALPIAAVLCIAITLGWIFLSPKLQQSQSNQLAVAKNAHKFSIPNTTLSPAMLPKGNSAELSSASGETGKNSSTLANGLTANISLTKSLKSLRHHRPHNQKIVIDESCDCPDIVRVVEETKPSDIATTAVTQFHKEVVEGKISGRITDDQGRGLPGARIIVKGSNTKVLSNSNGEFFLPADANKDSVTVQMIGYTTKHLAVNTTDKLDIKMDEEVTTLAGVEVTHKMRPADIHDAQPQLGWKAYKAYLADKAVLPSGETGKVKLKFLVDTQGHISNIRVIRGSSDTMNRKAIAMVENGPEWYGPEKQGVDDNPQKEIKLKIKFHKSDKDTQF